LISPTSCGESGKTKNENGELRGSGGEREEAQGARRMRTFAFSLSLQHDSPSSEHHLFTLFSSKPPPLENLFWNGKFASGNQKRNFR
jgi:hypothetical protein